MPLYLFRLYCLLFLVLPWSVDTAVSDGIHLLFPAEVIIGMINVILLYEVLKMERGTWLKFLLLPTRQAVGFYTKRNAVWLLWLIISWILWGWVTIIWSTMPWVSVKYQLVQTAYCFVFLIPALLWHQSWERSLRYLMFSTIGTLGWTWIRYGYVFHFRNDQANLAPMPFYDDHTIYAATLSILVFWVPVLRLSKWLIGLLAFGIIISTCRGALLSLPTALMVVGAARLMPHRWRLIGLILLFVGSFCVMYFFNTIAFKDVSMAERYNRYQSSIRMAESRPIVGFGAGTFQFQYLPFQRPDQMTRLSISVIQADRNPANFGRGGGAHSEYFQALTEMGYPGLFLLFGMVCAFLVLIPRAGSIAQPEYRLLVSAGLLTFFIHGLLNNFLHDTRIAALIWGSLGWLMVSVHENCDHR